MLSRSLRCFNSLTNIIRPWLRPLALTHAGRGLPAVHVVSPGELLPLAARAPPLLLRGHAQAQALRREGEVLHLQLVILAARDVCWLDGSHLHKISGIANFILKLNSSDFSSIPVFSKLREYCRILNLPFCALALSWIECFRISAPPSTLSPPVFHSSWDDNFNFGPFCYYLVMTSFLFNIIPKEFLYFDHLFLFYTISSRHLFKVFFWINFFKSWKQLYIPWLKECSQPPQFQTCPLGPHFLQLGDTIETEHDVIKMKYSR